MTTTAKSAGIIPQFIPAFRLLDRYHDELAKRISKIPLPEEWNAASMIPPVKSGECREFIVHARSKHGEKEYVFSAMYLNEMMLESPSTGEEEPSSGWHSAKEHSDYDGFYEALSSHDVLNWMELPLPPDVPVMHFSKEEQ